MTEHLFVILVFFVAICDFLPPCLIRVIRSIRGFLAVCIAY
jgi:hypothetical protein